MRDLPNLDFLRACAVLSVVVEHTMLAYGVRHLGRWDVSWIGVVGVFIFFVHTCLVLMWSMERKPHTLDFYIRRAFRIYPLAWMAMAATVLFHAPVGGTVQHYFQYAPTPHALGALVKGFFLVPNLGRTGPVFQPESVMWSLPLEVEMYLGLPLLFFFVRRNFSLWPLLSLWALVVLLNLPLFPMDGNNFYLAIPYFLPGVMAYVAFGRYRAVLPFWVFPCFLASIWLAFLWNPSWRRADLLCLGLGLALPFFKQMTWTPAIAASHALAKYSYGMYLSHPFAIVLGIHLLPNAPKTIQLGMVAGATALFSAAAYHLLERPMIRLGARTAQRAESRFEQREMGTQRIAEAEIA